MQFHSRNLTHLWTATHLISKIICSCNTAKIFSAFTNFPAKRFLFGVRKTFALHYFLKPSNCILETLWKKTSVYFCISSFQRKSLFQRCSMILYGWGWIRGRLNNFLKTAHCVRLVKCLIVFRLFFSISILPSIALKRWKFPENLDFKGRIVAKFLIRNHFLLIHNNMAIK